MSKSSKIAHFVSVPFFCSVSHLLLLFLCLSVSPLDTVLLALKNGRQVRTRARSAVLCAYRLRCARYRPLLLPFLHHFDLHPSSLCVHSVRLYLVALSLRRSLRTARTLLQCFRLHHCPFFSQSRHPLTLVTLFLLCSVPPAHAHVVPPYAPSNPTIVSPSFLSAFALSLCLLMCSLLLHVCTSHCTFRVRTPFPAHPPHCAYATVAPDTSPRTPPEPLYYTTAMDDAVLDIEDDEDIIFIDGGEVYSAFKYKSASPALVYTMYKRVDRKVKPVPAVFPEDARVLRKFPENPLDSLPQLPTHPPDFTPDGRLTHERLEAMNINADGFLLPEEEKLAVHVMQIHQNHFVFEDQQRGSFREDYFSPYIIPVVPHVPWAFNNIPIPPGIRERVVQLLREKIAAGVYEPSQSSYRSRWFCVLKKNGKLRIVHDLQPLNKVSIRDAGLPPNLDNFVEPFAGHQVYTVFDLYWGFDARKVHPQSRDLTAFLTPLGLLRITSLPTGFTNSPAEFQACMSFILQDEIPKVADIFIDDLPIKGPATVYPGPDGQPERIPENPGIRRFVWEHLQDVNRIIHRVGHAGGTFSPTKVQLAKQQVAIVGQLCTPEGRRPDPLKIDKILSWPPLKTVKDVRGFLGLCGTVRIWIKDYSAKARPLTELVRLDADFEWTERREQAFRVLKQAITSAPALHPIDYESDRPVVLSVDSSIIAVGFILSQLDEQHRKRPARYGSIPMNERESRYSQPKLELYGLFRALRAYRLYLIGVKRLRVEVDAKYIKGMLNDPDLQPNATINRWIQGILLFDFELVHVPATSFKGPDALSRRARSSSDTAHTEDDEWLDDIALLSYLPAVITRNLQHTGAFTLTSMIADHPPGDQQDLSPRDKVFIQIYDFLTTFTLPTGLSQKQRQRFIQKATRFYVQDRTMFKRNGSSPPLKCIFREARRARILQAAHEELGHRGEQSVMQTLRQRFYWPTMWGDCRRHVRSCHECQIRSVRKVESPLFISTPATIFVKIHMDVMFMPKSKGLRYIVAATDDLSAAGEGRALSNNTATLIGKFLWEEILCRYGAVGQITTDNGPEVQAAVTHLMNRWHIPKITISPYNSKANGVVERRHFIIREAIVKSCEGDTSRWPDYVHQAFFADRVTIRRATGMSPFYLLYGVQPVLPFDLYEASFLVEGFYRGMSTAELLSLRMRQLEKRPADLAAAAATLQRTRLQSKEQFERRFYAKLVKGSYAPGTLVLVRNNAIEKSHNRKHKPRYLGPYQIVRQTRNGSYVIEELDGSVSRHAIAANRIIPYISRSDVQLRSLQHVPPLSPEVSSEEDPANDEESST